MKNSLGYTTMGYLPFLALENFNSLRCEFISNFNIMKCEFISDFILFFYWRSSWKQPGFPSPTLPTGQKKQNWIYKTFFLWAVQNNFSNISLSQNKITTVCITNPHTERTWGRNQSYCYSSHLIKTVCYTVVPEFLFSTN